jgi:polyisoprenoid-binding protein YceI
MNGMPSITGFLQSADAVGIWTVVPGESRVEFANKTLWGLATVRGHFTQFSGHGEITAAGTVSGQIELEAESVQTGLKIRDKQLRSDDFFKTERFPQIVVVVTDAVFAGDDAVDLRASITVTGTTKPLPLRATVRGLDDGAVGVSTEKTIDHDELGIHWNRLWMISRYTAISADLVFRRSGG